VSSDGRPGWRWTGQERLGYIDVRTIMIYTHVLNRDGKGGIFNVDGYCDNRGDFRMDHHRRSLSKQ
jgi:hypothetical protein